MKLVNKIFNPFIFSLVLILFLSACKDDNLDLQNPVLTPSNESELGERLYQESMLVLDILEVQDYPALYEYLNSALNMAIINTRIKSRFNWEIAIYEDDDNYNIFALPGGKIFMSTGILTHLNAEHQLIALLSHEVYFSDRPVQGDRDDLSLVMQLLKSKFGTYGTKIFLDVVDGTSDEGSNMVLFLRNIMYEPYQVLDADEFALNTICGNYLYSPYGLEEVLITGSEISEFIWLDNRPPGRYSQMNDMTHNLQERLDNMNDWYMGCGSENADQYISRYNDFIEPLR